MSRRAQTVLIAAGVIAVALVPVLVAYLQLGYAADVAASDDYAAPGRNGERVLEVAVENASRGVPGEYGWEHRREAIDAVRTRLAEPLASLRTARLERGTAYRVSYNRTAAREWADRECPGGPDRAFGDCVAHRGVVVQERAGDTHVLAVAFDLTVVTDRGRVEETVVVRVIGGVDR